MRIRASVAVLLSVLATGALAAADNESAKESAEPAAAAATGDVIQSLWQPQEIRYSYVAFTTAYGCDAFEDKVRIILKALGAHPQTTVRTNGCDFNRPAMNFFVTITTATPVLASEANAQSIRLGSRTESQQKLLERLGVKSPVSTDAFPAQWKTVELSADRKLDIQPGDCELLEGLRDQVLPKLNIKVLSDTVRCIPKQLSILPPKLEVSALVPLPSADKGKPKA